MRDLFATRQFEKDISKISDDIRIQTEKMVCQLRLNPIS